MMKRLPIILACLALFAGVVFAADPVPTSDQLHQMLTDGQYQQVVTSIQRILGLKPDAQQGYDKYDLLMMRGEAHLHLKAAFAAADAFAQAQLAAEKPEDKQLARAYELLCRRCPRMVYVPVPQSVNGRPATQPSTPIDIIDPASRKEALAAYFADEVTRDKPRLAAAAERKNLPLMLEVAPLVGVLRTLEMASGGDGSKTKDAAGALPDQAAALMDAAVNSDDARVSELETKANSEVEFIGQNTANTYKNGLNLAEIGKLNEIAANCKKISDAATSMRIALGEDENEGVGKTAGEADRVAKHAIEVATAKYR